jgi:hypothetical protein
MLATMEWKSVCDFIMIGQESDEIHPGLDGIVGLFPASAQKWEYGTT